MIIKIIILYFVYFFSTLAHELGHIVMAKIFYNVENCKIDIGLGKRVVKFKGVTIKAIPGRGRAYWPIKDINTYYKSSKLRRIMPILGGPLVSFLITLGFVSISKNNYSYFYNEIIKSIIICNVICFAISILPLKDSDGLSDGMHIFNIIKYNKW